MAGTELTDMQMDALKEIGNMGAGNASAKLSELVDDMVALELTEMNIVSSSKLAEAYQSKDDDVVVSIFLRVIGDFVGSIVTLFPNKFAVTLVDMIQKRPIGTSKNITSANQEEFKVVGILLAQTYLNALSQFVGLNLKESDPIVQVNRRSIIMDFIVKGITSNVAEEILSIRTKFYIKKSDLKGEFLVLFGLKSLEQFKKIIEKKLMV